MRMQIGRWGNSLAVRLPKALVDRLGLKEGDEIDLSNVEASSQSDGRRERALEELRARAWIPAGYRFDREEFYDELVAERHGRS